MDSLTVAIVSGVVVPIVAAAAWTFAFRSDGAGGLFDRAMGNGPLDVPPVDAPPNMSACHSCGAPYPPVSNAVFCRHCGHHLKDAPPTKSALPH